MLLIHARDATPRLRYITGLMLGKLLGLEVVLTTSRDEFLASGAPRICYSDNPVEGAVNITPSSLLFEQVIRSWTPGVSSSGKIPLLFGTEDGQSDLPFDPFAAGFFMVSRYEEYLPHETDHHGRFQASESIARKGGFLRLPVVHHWAGMIGEVLLRKFPGIRIRKPEYRFVPTFDIDHAFCYLGRGVVRTLGGIGRSLMRGRLTDIADRLKVLTGAARDPYNTYTYIRKTLAVHGLDPLYFVLFADYGGDDNNVSTDSMAFRRLMQRLDQDGKLGIHPSLASGRDFMTLRGECEGLGDLLGREISMSRQHFLMLTFPKTCQDLLRAGIRDDYTLGYASEPGFRAGISVPFPFYDLSREEITGLTLHPMTLMDVTMREYLRLTPEESLELAAELISAVRAVNGEYISLWHNESLSDYGHWRGWRNTFEQMVALASA